MQVAVLRYRYRPMNGHTDRVASRMAMQRPQRRRYQVRFLGGPQLIEEARYGL